MFIFRASNTVSSPRAATRPSVENSAAGPTSSRSSTSFTMARISSWPDANPTSARASGPTSMGLPSYRGAFIQVYLAESCRYFQGVGGPVYFGVVSPSYGWSPAASPFEYSYHELVMYSFTWFWSYGQTLVRSRSSTIPRGK